MKTRLQMIGEIRDCIEEHYANGRFAFVAEVMGEVDRFNFTDVPDSTVSRIWSELHYDRGQ